LFSYALSMFNPGYDIAMAAARRDLVPGGRIAVVDFHDSRFGFFERWMGMNHVRMNGQLRPLLQSLFTPVTDCLCPAYAGLWRYLLFVGRKE
jgi:S-adenosylmethionine-diacylgycerolhomoserine-N-methlytransferase